MKKSFWGPFIACSISFVRILLAPFFIAAIKQKKLNTALAVSIIAGLSDFFDGKIARKFNWQSEFGANLDPVADKLFELSAINTLCQEGMLPKDYRILFNLRNVAQLMSFPILFILFPRPFKVKPKLPAKIATATGFATIFTALLNKIFGKNFRGLNLLQKAVLSCSKILELWILVTYIPRLIQIVNRTHDTFE